MIRLLTCLALTLLLGSCVTSTRSPGDVADTASPAVEPVPPARLDLLAAVRAAAGDAGDVIEIQPLRDPAVEDLRAVAAEAEARGDLEGAAAALEQALQIAKDDPQLMQEFAELLLAQDRLDDAERLAARSYDVGPKLGGLCRRNWATVQLARAHTGDPQGAADAAGRIARCVVEPQLRM